MNSDVITLVSGWVLITPSQLRGQRMIDSTDVVVEHASHLSWWSPQARNNVRDYREV